jgi:hypothetical protein
VARLKHHAIERLIELDAGLEALRAGGEALGRPHPRRTRQPRSVGKCLELVIFS